MLKEETKVTVNLLILLLLFVETHILCLGEASLAWGTMPSLKKGKKQGKSHFVAGTNLLFMKLSGNTTDRSFSPLWWQVRPLGIS